MCYKLGKVCVTNWDSFVLLQLGQTLQIGASFVTNWGKTYYKLGQVLQIRAIITNGDVTTSIIDKSP